ncbi:bifunctional DNA primase/polymerase [Mycolicibacterium bacteremicum]|uniref:bifunctional DNA primase/polymerase n=1 Tax=Mycolicibacterium bacteremicum TaxID=564198 RepID=UPI0026EA4559|nr:bifunctional DNA primase/polymerase [Mycolicibacterium bacteremicum]
MGQLSLKQAALAYAEAGWHIVPTRTGDVKNPGSIVGAAWQKKATCERAQIEQWWDEEPRIGGIAFHPGPSGVVAFDFDLDCQEKPDDMPREIWDALHTGAIQRTRATGERGHYLFATEASEFGCSAGGFMRWGQVRAQGGVVILAPTPHPDAEKGLYAWRKISDLPPLPDVLRQMLSAAAHDSAEPKTPEQLRSFLGKYTEDNEQRGLQGPLSQFDADVKGGGSRHEAMRDALPWAFRESIIGRFSAQFAYESLKFAFHKAKPEARFTGEFDRLAQWAAAQAELADPNETRAKVDRPENQPTVEPIFRQFGPTEWAKPVPVTEFLIKRVLATDTWGVNSGPEKSLKTHDNQAIGLAVATGINLYNDDRFAVQRPGKVLYIVGEGGQNQVRRVLHRMLTAYGVKPEDVARDPKFPFVVVFGAAPLDDARLRTEIRDLLDQHQPSLVLMESFYNFHPDVNASNLYERGQVIDSYHKLVRSGGADVVSLLTDHNKKGANKLGLQQISMAGQAENSDSWIQRAHRSDPDVQTGDFWLTTSFNGRDWGGTTYEVDWHLGPFDHDTGAHTGHISWDVRESRTAGSVVANATTITKTQRKELDTIAAIHKVLRDAHDSGVNFMNQSDLVENVKRLVPDAGKDFIVKKLDSGEKEGVLIAQPGPKNAKFYILTTHPMYSHD